MHRKCQKGSWKRQGEVTIHAGTSKQKDNHSTIENVMFGMTCINGLEAKTKIGQYLNTHSKTNEIPEKSIVAILLKGNSHTRIEMC